MSVFESGSNKAISSNAYHLTLSSGGSQSFLASLGAVIACHAAGLRQFRTLGGVSAGSICAALLSLGLDAVQLLHLGLELDFKAEIGTKGQLRNFLSALGSKATSTDCRHTGLLQTSSIGNYLDKIAEFRGCGGHWPAKFWTMATTKSGMPVVFKSDGVFLIERDNSVKQLSLEPPKLSDAVRMSCSIPGVFAAMKYQGKLMFDGALSRYGFCPVGLQIQHFGVDPRTIIACNLSVDRLDPISGSFHSLCRRTWGIDQKWEWDDDTVGVIEFRPQIYHVPALQFAFSQDAKWLAVLIAFESCCARLALEGVLHGERLEFVKQVLYELGNWRHAKPALQKRPQLLAKRAETVFCAHGLF